MTFLYKSDPVRGEQWAQLFRVLAPEVPFYVWPETGDPGAVKYIAAWQPPEDLSATFPALEVIFSVGAGIDQFNLAAIPKHIPIVRMLEPGIAESMIEYVTQSVLAIHRDIPQYALQQRERLWKALPVRPASSRRIGVLGLGVLGNGVLEQLQHWGFACAAWSRSPRDIAGVQTYSGYDQLDDFLARTDILVCLLPLTAQTQGILNRELFYKLPRGASLIQTGRGAHLVQADLLEALDSGQIRFAMLDVAHSEPLPPDDVLWAHPRVRITPHIASATRPEGAVEAVLANIQRHREGLPMHGQIDRERGY